MHISKYFGIKFIVLSFSFFVIQLWFFENEEVFIPILLTKFFVRLNLDLIFLAFAEVIKELWAEDSCDRVVNTASLKGQIQRFAPRFMGFAQQDAQEFLRYLLEGLHEDVNRVKEKPKPIHTEIDDKLRWENKEPVILEITENRSYFKISKLFLF